MAESVKDITKKLKSIGADEALIESIIKQLEAARMEETEGRIIRTNKGALMVRLSPDRWPIGMYAKDWRILLRLAPAIEEALDTMNILEENPQKSERQEKQIEAARAAEVAVRAKTA